MDAGLSGKLNKSNEQWKIYGTDLAGGTYMRDVSWHPVGISQAIVQFDTEGQIQVNALILKSPNGTKYKLTVADDGTLSTAKVD